MSPVAFEEVKDTRAMTLPPVGEKVFVQCEGFRCLGYRTADGKWKSAHDGQELPKVLSFIPLNWD